MPCTAMASPGHVVLANFDRETTMKTRITKIVKIDKRMLITGKQLKDYGIPFSQRQLYEMIKNEEFPMPKKISTRLIGWRPKDIEEWVNDLPNARIGMKKAG